MKMSPLGGVWGRSVPSANLGPPYISKTVRARMLKFYTFKWGQVHFLKMEIFFATGRAWCVALPIVNRETSNISETSIARKSKF